jgi:hypothetical protein
MVFAFLKKQYGWFVVHSREVCLAIAEANFKGKVEEFKFAGFFENNALVHCIHACPTTQLLRQGNARPHSFVLLFARSIPQIALSHDCGTRSYGMRCR